MSSRASGNELRPKVIVSGAGGFVGRALVPALQARGARVVRLVRGAAISGEGHVAWDPARGVDDLEALEGAEAAIHLGGENLASGLWTAARKQRLRESRIRSTSTLANALVGLESPPRAFLTASAVGWYGHRGDESLDENSTAGSGFLAELCRDWEDAAAPAREAGIRWAALRFGLILGPGGVLAKMLPAFRIGLGAVLGNGRQFMSWIEIGDTAAAVAHVLDTDELEGPVNLVAPKPITNREFTETLARVLRRPAFLVAPELVLRPLGEMGRETLLASQCVAPKRLLATGFEYRYPDLEAALRQTWSESGVDRP